MSHTPYPNADSHQSTLSTAPLVAAVEGFTDSASAMAHRAADQTRAQAGRLLDAGTSHIRERPVQSMLMAAATGAVIVLLMELVVRAARSSR